MLNYVLFKSKSAMIDPIIVQIMIKAKIYNYYNEEGVFVN